MISIIGGSGFVGTRLAKRFINSGVDFKILDKQDSVEYSSHREVCDVRHREQLENTLKGSNVIINLAAEHRDDVTPVSLYDEVNVDGARNVCRVAESLGINTIIFTSSVAVYGESKGDTDESGEFNFFNNYGRTKKEAEDVYLEWFKNDESNRSLIIIRPTVIFGEGNRGNVYNLLNQMASGKFLMIGNGKNKKSMAYVENIAAFIEFCTGSEKKGLQLYNYIDKPDFDMNSLVLTVKRILGKGDKIKFRVPYFIGYCGGICFDILAKLTGKKFPISAIRVKKFCMNTTFKSSNIQSTGFVAPVPLQEALDRTVSHEFLGK
ncbi:MAG: NAD-dependent epimerase/dehydratase family protein [Spirochaetales bacterium]|nr:NAD-dependent epimerase/dehydratase family protein [Spirochaetales bacterium]